MAAAGQTEWAPTPASIVALGVGGAALLACGLTLVTDVPGKWLAVLVGSGLLLFAAATWRSRPKLAITAAGLVLRGWFGAQTLTREDLELIRVTEFRRFGRRQRMLELEAAGEWLRVYTRWDLGTDPIAVLDALTAAGYAAPRAPRPPK